MKKNYIQIISAMLIYSTVGIVVSIIPIKSIQIAFSRSFIGAITLIIISIITKEEFNIEKIKKNKWAIICAGLFQAISWSLLFESYNYINVGVSAILHDLFPIFVLILSKLFLNIKLTKDKIIGIIIALLGMILINIKSTGGTNPRLGAILAVGSAIAYAGVMVSNKLIVGMTGLNLTTLQLIICSIVMGIYGFITGNIPFEIPTKLSLFGLMSLGIIHTALACVLHFSAVQKLPIQTSALLSYIDPLSALILSGIILGEELKWIQILGITFILIGTIFGELYEKIRLKFKY